MIDWWLNKFRLCTTLWCSSNSGVPMRRCLSGCRRRFRCCRYCCTCCRLSCGCCAGCCGDWIHFCRKQLTHWCKGIGFLIKHFFYFWNWTTDEQTDKDLPWHRQCEAGQYPVAQLFWHHVSMFACPAHAPAAKQTLEDLRWRDSPEHGGTLHSSPSHWDRHHQRIKSELGETFFLHTQKKSEVI